MEATGGWRQEAITRRKRGIEEPREVSEEAMSAQKGKGAECVEKVQ